MIEKAGSSLGSAGVVEQPLSRSWSRANGVDALNIAMTTTILSGGAGKQVRLLAGELVALGHRVTIFVPRDTHPTGEDLQGFKVVEVGPRLPKRAYGYALRPFALAAGLLSVDFSTFDVVHSHGWEVAAARSRRRSVRTFYGSAIDEVLHSQLDSAKRLAWLAYQLFGVLLEQSTALTARIRVGISPVTKKRVPAVQHIIPCCVDQRRYKPSSSGPRESLTILSVGTTYFGRKRLWLLHEVFQRHIRPALPTAELWLVTREQVSTPGVRCFSNLPEARLIELYQQASVFCLPSTYEGFGVPYIEAMACGTPVVATRNPGATWILADGRYGLISADEALASTLLTVLRDERARQALAERATQRVADFSSETTAQRYLDLYRSLAPGPPVVRDPGSVS